MRESAIRWTDWAPFLVIAIVFGASYLLELRSFGMFVWDEAEYAAIGRSVARGEGFAISGRPNALRPPVLPLSVAAALTVRGGQSDAAAKIPAPCFALLALAVVYGLVWRVSGPIAASFAAWSLAICPEFWMRAVLLLSEMPFMAFHTASVGAFFLAVHRNPRWLYAAWVFVALSLLTRYTALLLGPTLILISAFELVRDRRAALRLARSRPMWLGPLLGLALLAPWLLREWIVFGDPLIGAKQSANQIPAYTVAVMPWDFYFRAIPYAASWPVAALGGAGLALALLRRRALGYYALAAVTVLIGWHMQYDFKSVRLMVPALPFLAIGVGLLHQELAAKRKRLAGLGLGGTLLIAGLSNHARVQTAFQGQLALGEPSFLEAMAHLRASTPPDVTVASSSVPQVHWYADRRVVDLPSTEAELIQHLEEVDWLVVTDFERGQPAYLAVIARELEGGGYPSYAVRAFHDSQFQTMLVRSEWLLLRTGKEDRDSR